MNSVLSPYAGEPNGLVGEDAAVLRRLAFFEHLEQRVILHAGDEEHAGLSPAGKQAVVVVAAIIDHHRARSEADLMGHLDVMDSALGDHPKQGR
jgi:hypothetical protein